MQDCHTAGLLLLRQAQARPVYTSSTGFLVLLNQGIFSRTGSEFSNLRTKLLGAPGLSTRSDRTLLGAPGITTSCILTSRNKKLLGTSASLLVTSALLVVTRSSATIRSGLRSSATLRFTSQRGLGHGDRRCDSVRRGGRGQRFDRCHEVAEEDHPRGFTEFTVLCHFSGGKQLIPGSVWQLYTEH